MPMYEVGFIFDRSFVQKDIELSSGVKISPLYKTGSNGHIRDIRARLQASNFSFTQKDLARTLENYENTGHCTLVLFSGVESAGYVGAIESKEAEAENVVNALSVVSANPATSMCAFAKSSGDCGVKFFIPPDRIIRHGNNIPGFLDALPEIEKRAQEDAKFSLLLRLFRASLREDDVDNQVLFSLILLEEASDGEEGVFAERLRGFAQNTGFDGDLALVAEDCGVSLPVGKDVIDLIVKLRNAAAHNGCLTEASLLEYNGEWALPAIQDKERLHKLITESVRYMFCAMVGHTRDAMAMKVTGPIEVDFS